MQSSTVVRRTDAGSAELAAPAHGLSLTQRRFLTLLDTACTVDDLAVRHPAHAQKFERDLTRLAELGLVACDVPSPANEVMGAPMAVAVRLGAPRLVRRLSWILLPVAAALAWAAWHQWAPAAGEASGHGLRANVVPAVTHEPRKARLDDPEPIATRVLKGDPAERTRDAAKEQRGQAKAAERPGENPPARPVNLPVEHRSPSNDAASATTMAVAPPVLPLQLAALPLPSSMNAVPLARMMAPVMPGPTSNGGSSAAAETPPIQVAAIAPAGAAPRPAPLPALVPIARESPSFPREAIAVGLANGNVKARLTIDARGYVSNVDIVEASHRAFTRAVRETLMRWRFEPGSGGRSTSVDVAFRRD